MFIFTKRNKNILLLHSIFFQIMNNLILHDSIFIQIIHNISPNIENNTFLTSKMKMYLDHYLNLGKI